MPSDQTTRLAHLMTGLASSLDRERDGSRLDADGDAGAALGGNGDRFAPARALQVAEGRHDTDELRAGLELPLVGSRLGGAQLVFLATDQIAAQGLSLLLEEREEVGAVERRHRLQLIDPHDDGRRPAPKIGVRRRIGLERAFDEGGATPTANYKSDQEK